MVARFGDDAGRFGIFRARDDVVDVDFRPVEAICFAHLAAKVFASAVEPPDGKTTQFF